VRNRREFSARLVAKCRGYVNGDLDMGPGAGPAPEEQEGSWIAFYVTWPRKCRTKARAGRAENPDG
jgi:hypothetical protein